MGRMKCDKELICIRCNKDFLGYGKHQKRCTDCQADHNKDKSEYRYKRVCVDCGEDFRSKNGRAPRCKKCWHNSECVICKSHFKRKTQTKLYCSPKCSAVAKADYYYCGNYSKTLIRDDWSCRKCGSKETLNVHHIDHSGAENIKTFNANNELNNLITLCISCHNEVHTMTDQFLVKKYKEDVINILKEFLGGEI